MRKFIIIGEPANSPLIDQLIKDAELALSEKLEIVEISSEKERGIIIESAPTKFTPDPSSFEYKLISPRHEFESNKPKGHIRPYKYHR